MILILTKYTQYKVINRLPSKSEVKFQAIQNHLIDSSQIQLKLIIIILIISGDNNLNIYIIN